MPFSNRDEAGRMITQHLRERRFDTPPIVMALPRGGVPIGYAIAKELKVPLDVLVTRKIGVPGNPEYGIGAITEDGFYWIDQERAASEGATDSYIRETLLHEGNEVTRKTKQYRKGKPRIPVQGRTIILVDDGLATGVTARVAAHYLKYQGAHRVILAIPVCASETATYLRSKIDEVLCLEEPEFFFSVGQFYQDFNPVSDEEVSSLLSQCSEFSPSMAELPSEKWISREVRVEEQLDLWGHLTIPPSAQGIVIFAHGSGSSRLSPRNQLVAQTLNNAGFGTLLFDLLTEEESLDRSNVFDIPLLADRLVLTTRWLRRQEEALHSPLGFFGASTGAAAALWAAATLRQEVSAIVSRGGRPDLAIPKLPEVSAPTLLIVGDNDEPVLTMNREALKYIKTGNLVIVPGATHLFEEPGALEAVAQHAVAWFKKYLGRKTHHEAA